MGDAWDSSVETERQAIDQAEQPGLGAVLAAVRTLSAQTEVAAVARTLLRIVLEETGASRALLLCLRAGQLRIEGCAELGEGGIRVCDDQDNDNDGDAPSADDLPLSLVQQVLRSGQGAAAPQGAAARAGDPYLAATPGCAAVCLPMSHQGRLVGVLYAERQPGAAAFSSACMALLEMLAAQAAVSLETARLVTALVAENLNRRRVEQALRESQATLMLGEQINRSGSWTWQTGEASLRCSAQCCRMFGFGLRAAPVSFERFLGRVHPDDRERVRLAALDGVAAGLTVAIDYRVLDEDGGVRFISSVARPLVVAGRASVADPGGANADAGGAHGADGWAGAPMHASYVGTAVDVTARRAAEDTLRQAQAELARVARITTVGQLTASIAHEVNQPLMSISSNAGASLRWLARAAPPLDEVRASLEDIASESQRAGAIISNLQALTRKSTPAWRAVDLHQTVRDILDISRAELERHGIALELALMAVSGKVPGDAVQLQQLLLNLVINAIEAMAATSGRSRLLAICSWSTDGGELLMRVDDTGVGLDGASGDELFAPFYTTKPNGMGMGLAICRSIAKAHHGTVTAAARLPAGCSMSLRLPEIT